MKSDKTLNFWAIENIIEPRNSYLITGEKAMGVTAFGLSLLLQQSDLSIGIISCSRSVEETKDHLLKLDSNYSSNFQIVQATSKSELVQLLKSNWITTIDILFIDELDVLVGDQLEAILGLVEKIQSNTHLTVLYSLVQKNPYPIHRYLHDYYRFVSKRIKVFRPEYYGIMEDSLGNDNCAKTIVTICSTKNVQEMKQFQFEFKGNEGGLFINPTEYNLLV